jgi:hypothetical protein
VKAAKKDEESSSEDPTEASSEESSSSDSEEEKITKKTSATAKVNGVGNHVCIPLDMTHNHFIRVLNAMHP